MRCGLTFGDVEEDVGNLQDVVEVFFYTRPPFENLVFVASDFEALLA